MKKQRVSLYLLLAMALVWHTTQAQQKARQFYQLTVYHFATAEQEKMLDNYFEHALLPALQRMKAGPVGVFSAIANDTATNKTMMVLWPMKELQDVQQIPAKLKADKNYASAAADYIQAGYQTPPYTRMETILLHAFALSPKIEVPKLTSTTAERVYELRSYESATEKIFANKVHMFNEGDEIGLFKRLNFNAVFYGEVVAGSKMPNLMYMTSFENMADRDAHWKTFVADPQWKQLSTMPEYQKNVSHIDITFLRARPYSQL